MRYFVWINLALLGIAGCMAKQRAVSSSEMVAPVKVETVAASYQQYQRMTKGPVFVNPALAAMCSSVAVQSMLEEDRAKYGPHAQAQVIVYMNDLAAQTFGGGSPRYPVGSVVVKEKIWKFDPATVAQHPAGTDGVGGMIKRPAGYDPAHGNWEFFYFDSPSKIVSGKMESCVRCHRGAASKGYVFGDWARGG